MSHDGNVIHHITQMRELVDRLTVRGNDVKDDHVVAPLLVSVSTLYDN